MMKTRSRLTALLLAFMMVLSLVPTTLMTTAAAADPVSPAVGDFLYFGNWDGDPIKWRVLDADSTNTGDPNGIYLVSEYVLGDPFPFFESPTSGTPNEWSASNGGKWCMEFAWGGFTGYSDYIPDGSGLNSREASTVLDTTINDAEGQITGASYNARSIDNEKVFFMSVQETIDYLGYDPDSSSGVDNVKAYLPEPVIDPNMGPIYLSRPWWLRSPGSDATQENGVNPDVRTLPSESDTVRARPALNLGRNRCVFTSDVADAAGSEALVFVPKEGTTNEWRLATADEMRPAAPTGLSATAPTTPDGSDGTITGVDETMEWASDEAFTRSTPVTGTSITGLAAGTYYVRVARTGPTMEGHAATVVVPAAAAVPDDEYTVAVSPADATTVHAGDAVTVTVDIDSATADYAGVSFELTWDDSLFEAPAELPENWIQKTDCLLYADESSSKSEDYELTFTAKAQTEEKTGTFAVRDVAVAVSAQAALDGTPDLTLADASSAEVTIALKSVTADTLEPDADSTGETTTETVGTITDTAAKFDYTTTVTYDSAEHTFPVPTLADQTAIDGGSALTLTYSATADGSYTADIPAAETDAGTHTVYYKGTINGFAQEISGVLTLQIEKKDITGATVTLDSAELTYTGAEQTVTVTSVEIDGITVPASEYTVTGDKGTNAGDYTLTVTVKDDSVNFKGTQTAAWKIAGGTGSATVTPATDIVDNGSNQSLSAAITDIPDDAAVTYSSTEDGTYDAAVPEAKDAGTHTVYFTITSANWAAPYKGSYQVTIAPKPISITIDAVEKYVGEADPALTHQAVTGLAAGDTEEGLGISLTRAEGESAGEYAINGTVSNTNYDATFVNANMTIKEAVAGTDYFVELVNSGNATYGVDYATGWSLVLVYTDKDMTFNYDGALMLDVTDSGYQYDNTTTYTHVYGYVVEGAGSADKVAIANVGSTPTTVTYDNDVNGSGQVTIGDVVATSASRTLDGVTVTEANMSSVLKADLNHDKTVDGTDVALVKEAFINGQG